VQLVKLRKILAETLYCNRFPVTLQW